MTSINLAHDTFPSKLLRDNPLKGQWRFVNISTPSQKKDAAIRKIVRGQAMRDFRRRQRQKQTTSHELVKARQEPASGQAPPSKDDAQEDPDADILPVVVSSTCTESAVIPQTLLNACTSDPFNVYPVCNDVRGQQLLSHCK